MVSDSRKVPGEHEGCGLDPDWYTQSLEVVEGLPEPLRSHGVRLCEEALATWCVAPGDVRIPWELQEELQGLQYEQAQIQAISPGRRQAYLVQIGYAMQYL